MEIAQMERVQPTRGTAVTTTGLTPSRFEWERALREADVPWHLKSFLLLVGTWMDGETGGNAYPASTTLQRATGLSRQRVFELLALADKTGWLITVKRKGTSSMRLPAVPSVHSVAPVVHSPTKTRPTRQTHLTTPSDPSDAPRQTRLTQSIIDHTETNQAGSAARVEASPATVAEPACLPAPTEGQKLLQDLPLPWKVSQQVIRQCREHVDTLLGTWTQQALTEHLVAEMAGGKLGNPMGRLTKAIRDTEPRLVALKAVVQPIGKPCGHCEGRPDEPISSRTLWVSQSTGERVYEWTDGDSLVVKCPNCHPHAMARTA